MGQVNTPYQMKPRFKILGIFPFLKKEEFGIWMTIDPLIQCAQFMDEKILFDWMMESSKLAHSQTKPPLCYCLSGIFILLHLTLHPLYNSELKYVYVVYTIFT